MRVYKQLIALTLVLLTLSCSDHQAYTVEQLVEQDGLREQEETRCNGLTPADLMVDQGCTNLKAAHSQLLRKDYTNMGSERNVLKALPKLH